MSVAGRRGSASQLNAEIAHRLREHVRGPAVVADASPGPRPVMVRLPRRRWLRLDRSIDRLHSPTTRDLDESSICFATAAGGPPWSGRGTS